MDNKKKKRIFIEAHYLEIGGAEISLIGLLNAIDYSKYDVDLFLYAHRGELMKFIPKDVNLLPEIPEYVQIEAPLKNVFKNKFFKIGITRLIAKYKIYRLKKKLNGVETESIYQIIDDSLMPHLPSMYNLGTYDLAINFIALKGHIPNKILAKKTITWIHTDLKTVNTIPDLEYNSWNSYDYIVSISSSVTNKFTELFPTLKSKIIEIENILSPKFIIDRSKENTIELKGNPTLLSVGRFCYAKNYDNVPDITRRLVEMGHKDLKWYIVGYGGDENLIREKIKEAGMEDYVIILGKKENPYPYIKACDIYVQPSRYEGKSVTVREAQMLCKPVVITSYPTAESQVLNGCNGIIVPMENKECSKGLDSFIKNKELQQKIIENLHMSNFGNHNEIEKIYALLD